MKTIYKYEIPLQKRFILQLPENAKVLTVQTLMVEVEGLYDKHERPFIWAIIDTEEPLLGREFSMVGTGHDLEYYATQEEYIGTFQIKKYDFVFHVFGIKGIKYENDS